MSKIQALLFDLDGTLLDSAPDLVGALNWVRAGEGLEALEVGSMSRYVSRGAAGLLQAGMPAVDQPQFNAWKSKFLAFYAENCFVHSRLFDGVMDLLMFLEGQGIPWGIVTNKIESLTVPIIKAAGIFHHASCVICGDTLKRCKPDPAPVRLACSRLQVSLDSTLFAGDDIRDLQAGRAAGTQIAVVHYGYGDYPSGDELVTASLQVYKPADLVDIIARRNG